MVEQDEVSVRSPLGMVTEEPALNGFVSYLTGFLSHLRETVEVPGATVEMAFSRSRLKEVKQTFLAMILRGEEKLHRLAEGVSKEFLPAYDVQSVVIGEWELTKERFILSQQIAVGDLYSTSDIDLGTRQIDKLRFRVGEAWSTASLVANFVEYQPTEPNTLRIQKLISRIKAEEEIWNKVVDEIFDLDGMVRRDKQMSHLSFFVKDVFGLKIVVGMPSDVVPAHQALLNATFDGEALELIEAKDYLDAEKRKSSGWTAMKSVVKWSGKTFEIQIQPLRVYFNEREHLTRESHAGFKMRRETLREQIALKVPLFGFYQALLRWLFLADADPARVPYYPAARIVVTD